MVIVTNHAEKRIKRLGLSTKKALEIATEAFECGVKRDECTGSLKKYFDSLFTATSQDRIAMFLPPGGSRVKE